MAPQVLAGVAAVEASLGGVPLSIAAVERGVRTFLRADRAAAEVLFAAKGLGAAAAYWSRRSQAVRYLQPRLVRLRKVPASGQVLAEVRGEELVFWGLGSNGFQATQDLHKRVGVVLAREWRRLRREMKAERAGEGQSV